MSSDMKAMRIHELGGGFQLENIPIPKHHSPITLFPGEQMTYQPQQL